MAVERSPVEGGGGVGLTKGRFGVRTFRLHGWGRGKGLSQGRGKRAPFSTVGREDAVVIVFLPSHWGGGKGA